MQRKQGEQNAELARQREELAAQQREFQRQKEAAAKAEQDRLDAIELERRIAAAKEMAEKMRPFSEQLESFASRVMLLANEAPRVSPSVDDEVTGAIVDAATEIHNIAERLVAIPGLEPKQEDELSDV